MLEEASWIATIIGAFIALVALFWAGKTISNRNETRQNIKISGNYNSVNQSSKVESDE